MLLNKTVYLLCSLPKYITFVLKIDIKTALKRLSKRKQKNRYDKFSKKFYINAQNAFIKIAKKNKKRYFILDNKNDTKNIIIYIDDMENFKKKRKKRFWEKLLSDNNE